MDVLMNKRADCQIGATSQHDVCPRQKQKQLKPLFDCAEFDPPLESPLQDLSDGANPKTREQTLAVQLVHEDRSQAVCENQNSRREGLEQAKHTNHLEITINCIPNLKTPTDIELNF
jgi:hypothetical protein